MTKRKKISGKKPQSPKPRSSDLTGSKFATHKKVVVAKIMLQAQSYLEVGSGQEKSIINQQSIDPSIIQNLEYSQIEQYSRVWKVSPLKLLHNYSGEYVIPGSTLKGFSRSRYELYNHPRDCFIVPSNKEDKRSWAHHQLFDITPTDHTIKTKFNCEICIAYGSFKDGGSLISFSDAKLNIRKPNNQEDFVEEASINPFEKGSVKDLHEMFKSGAKFFFTITMKDLADEQIAKVLESLGVLSGNSRLLGFSKYKKQEINNFQTELGVVECALYDLSVFKKDSLGILRKESYLQGKIGLSKDEKIQLKIEYINKYKDKWDNNLKSSDFETQDEHDVLADILNQN
jgi:hypothetical protein